MKTLKRLLETDRTPDYKYTVKNDEAGRGKIRNTKRLSSLHNLAAGVFGRNERTRVEPRGRLGKGNPERWQYSKHTGPLHRHGGQRIKPEHSRSFDVYVRRRDRDA